MGEDDRGAGRGVQSVGCAGGVTGQAASSDHARTDIEFHVARASTYDDEVTDAYTIYDRAALLPFLDRFAGKGSTFIVLDLGCGTGAVTVHLVSRGFTIHAVDHSPDMIAVAKKKLRRENALDRVAFHVCEAGDLPFQDGTFDLVTCQRVLHHIHDIRPVFAEVERVLKPGGWFYLSDAVTDSTPAARALRSLWKTLRSLREALVPRLEEPKVLRGSPPVHSIHRRADELERLLDAQGFSYELRFFTHVGLQRYLSTRQRAFVINVLSAPWKKRGDMLFVYASKPTRAPARPGSLEPPVPTHR